MGTRAHGQREQDQERREEAPIVDPHLNLLPRHWAVVCDRSCHQGYLTARLISHIPGSIGSRESLRLSGHRDFLFTVNFGRGYPVPPRMTDNRALKSCSRGCLNGSGIMPSARYPGPRAHGIVHGVSERMFRQAMMQSAPLPLLRVAPMELLQFRIGRRQACEQQLVSLRCRVFPQRPTWAFQHAQPDRHVGHRNRVGGGFRQHSFPYGLP